MAETTTNNEVKMNGANDSEKDALGSAGQKIKTDKSKEKIKREDRAQNKASNINNGEDTNRSKECVLDNEQKDKKIKGRGEDELVEESKENEKEGEEREEKKEDDFKNKYYYLAAEMDNMRKRFAREKENLLKFGNDRILSSLIEVIDNLEHTITALDNEKDEKILNIVKGVTMVKDHFLEVLKKFGLEQIESLGTVFDPNHHEAMAQQPVEGKKDHEVISEYKKGYMLNGRLLRAAKVIIATPAVVEKKATGQDEKSGNTVESKKDKQ